MAEFNTPAFLQNHSPEEVHALMKRVLPADIDMSPGSHAYNLTIATALAISEVCEFVLPEVIKLIFPEYSYGEFLDRHAKARGITRRQAAVAIGKLTITGDPGTVIPTGSIFSTAAVGDQPSVSYKTLEEAEIPASGSITLDVECTEAGTIGNAPENTVVLVSNRLPGITGVTNEEPMAGGTEEESDDSLKERIDAVDKGREDNIGNVADYYRWAMSVDGVGSAIVIPPEDTSGLITIVITDTDGNPATKSLCRRVYNEIMGNPFFPSTRLAPVNALLEVVPPETMQISITATVELSEGAALEDVKKAYKEQLTLYLPEAMEAGEIKYSRIAAALAAVDGANDYTDVLIGLKDGDAVTYGTSNIAMSTGALPSIDDDDLILTAGTV